jgi:hypothetical protein
MLSSPLCDPSAGRTWTVAEVQERERLRAQEEIKLRNAAVLQRLTREWSERGPTQIIAEIEKSGDRRVFLADDGAVMVRGRGTSEHLKIALRNHERIVRAILLDREAIEELIPAPEPTAPATRAA